MNEVFLQLNSPDWFEDERVYDAKSLTDIIINFVQTVSENDLKLSEWNPEFSVPVLVPNTISYRYLNGGICINFRRYSATVWWYIGDKNGRYTMHDSVLGGFNTDENRSLFFNNMKCFLSQVF